MRRKVPQIQALVALEAADRLGTLWQAADELGITRSAVSHRIALLEYCLGYDVLERSGKGVSLTARGKRYVQGVRKALAVLADVSDDTDRTAIGGTLRISSTPGFAATWLCNHIADFYEEYPNVTLEIVTSREMSDVSDSSIDVFIAFGDGNWPNYLLKKLYDVEHLPLCSPMLLNKRGGIGQPADLLRFPLLHLVSRDEWSRWLAANGVEADNAPGIMFSDMMLVQAAAIAGQGVMMGNNVTYSRLLSTGELVCPFTATVSAIGSYYLVINRRRQQRPAVQTFSVWLQALIAGGRQRVPDERRPGPIPSAPTDPPRRRSSRRRDR
jgi:LysR family glycine cleavage system transcriptional activator